MKAVLISIQPKWVEKLANREKTIEVRKSRPKIETPFKCYIYVTKPKKWFRFSSWGRASDECLWLSNGKVKMCDGFEFWADGKEYEPLCCKVIGEFVCDKIVKYDYQVIACAKYEVNGAYVKEELRYNAGACLTAEEMFSYSKGKPLYGWHISDLKIYDKPKELSEFKTPPCEKSEKACGNCKWLVKRNTPDVYECECYVEDGRPITRPPQSYMFVEEVEQ